jgi:2'-5' RNA ligase
VAPIAAGARASFLNVVECAAMEQARSARVFLAVNISPENASIVAERQSVYRRCVPAGLFRFGDAEQAHVTLRFLGLRTEAEQASILRASSEVAGRTAPFSVAFGGLGFFPDARRPHTFWTGLAEGRAALAGLAADLETTLAGAGFVPEGRLYVPHLTLARVKGRLPAGLAEQLLESGFEPTQPQTVDSFALLESRATPRGVRYVPLRVFRLESACTRFE